MFSPGVRCKIIIIAAGGGYGPGFSTGAPRRRTSFEASKDATVTSFHYSSVRELRHHVRDWLIAYNFAEQLKVLRFKTPYEAIEERWKSKPDALSFSLTITH